MKQWEYLRASILEVRITKIGLPAASFSRLKDILDIQFQEECCTEIMGSVFTTKDTAMPLEFEVIRPPEVTEVEAALKSFRQRDFSKIGLLADYITTKTEVIERYHGVNLTLSITAEIFAAVAQKPALLENFNNETIQDYFDLYKLFLKSNTAALGKDIKADQKDFLSIFHCHANGTPPSPMDIQANVKTGIPDVVISAKEDYLQSGIALYLVAGGEVKELYQGPIPLDGKK